MILPLLAALAVMMGPAVSHAATFKTLHQFASGRDGANPMGDLTVFNGKLYGTTSAGGAMGVGVIFYMDPTTGAETVLHELQNNEEGGVPYAGLLAWRGKLYGTAMQGGGVWRGVGF
jgi:uncharacterized repeat protein (TIGR03803 family)